MTKALRVGDCVRVPDGRIGRVRQIVDGNYRVRVRRATSATHQFLIFPRGLLKRVACPNGWMSPIGYERYLRVTLAKMHRRRGQTKSRGR